MWRERKKGKKHRWYTCRHTAKVNDNSNGSCSTTVDCGWERNARWGKRTASSTFSLVIKLYFMIWHVIFFYCMMIFPSPHTKQRDTVRTPHLTSHIAHAYTEPPSNNWVHFYNDTQHSKKLSHIMRLWMLRPMPRMESKRKERKGRTKWVKTGPDQASQTNQTNKQLIYTIRKILRFRINNDVESRFNFWCMFRIHVLCVCLRLCLWIYIDNSNSYWTQFCFSILLAVLFLNMCERIFHVFMFNGDATPNIKNTFKSILHIIHFILWRKSEVWGKTEKRKESR